LSFIAGTTGSNLALNIVSRAGGDAQLIDVGAPYYWTWAPDSQSLVIHAGSGTGGAAAHLSLLQLSDTVTEMGLEIEPALFKSPDYSPDGSRLLVAGRTPDDKTALLVADAAGHDPQSVAEYDGGIAFAWSPDGKRIAYITSQGSQLGAEGELTIVDPSGAQGPITLNDELAHAFFWSPDSRSLAYFTTEVVTLPTPEGEQEEEATTYTLWHLNVMDAGNGRTREVASFVPTEVFLRVVPYFDQYHQSETIWSPDSRNLVLSAYIVNDQAFRANGETAPGIWVVAASGTLEARFMAAGYVAFWSWE
jgi:Tol biopolymer transport system component